ncbi:diphosphomevalonate decarboxylase [Diaphorina citri]|uniref:Diphosphomevalonate decarboxylase n=1 Tax=Diaphorina citri TaxID=121845 RepID=A0A3Q0ILS7_DIACI|nr:diphosphomevalonate decarboxylase [Diaphorina citri]
MVDTVFNVAYTFDAGPNACLYVLENTVPLLLSTLVQYFPPSSGISAPYIRGLEYLNILPPVQMHAKTSVALSPDFTEDKPMMHAKTSVALSPDFTEDKLWLNGKEVSVHHPRISACLTDLRKLAEQEKSSREMADWKMHICSENNFPTAAGLASSAAGYSCLVFTLAYALGLNTSEVSHIARQGSGSACRSMFGGFVRWKTLPEGQQSDGNGDIGRKQCELSNAEQIISESYWGSMRVIILVVNDQAKSTSSTDGMQRTTLTSTLYEHRVNTIVPSRCSGMEEALRARDFPRFAELTMKDSNQFHACCLDTYPPIVYMNDTSHSIVRFVHEFNTVVGETKVAYTFDAGPNACLYVLENTVPLLLSTLVQYFPPSSGISAPYIRGLEYLNILPPVQLPSFTPQPAGLLQYLISTKIGSGPKILDDIPNNHLLNEAGAPKHLSS